MNIKSRKDLNKQMYNITKHALKDSKTYDFYSLNEEMGRILCYYYSNADTVKCNVIVSHTDRVYNMFIEVPLKNITELSDSNVIQLYRVIGQLDIVKRTALKVNIDNDTLVVAGRVNLVLNDEWEDVRNMLKHSLISLIRELIKLTDDLIIEILSRYKENYKAKQITYKYEPLHSLINQLNSVTHYEIENNNIVRKRNQVEFKTYLSTIPFIPNIILSKEKLKLETGKLNLDAAIPEVLTQALIIQDFVKETNKLKPINVQYDSDTSILYIEMDNNGNLDDMLDNMSKLLYRVIFFLMGKENTLDGYMDTGIKPGYYINNITYTK